MDSFKDIINLWPTAAEFARDVGTSPANARSMRMLNRIPDDYWAETVRCAAVRGFEGVTLDCLADLADQRRRQKARASAEAAASSVVAAGGG